MDKKLILNIIHYKFLNLKIVKSNFTYIVTGALYVSQSV
jgi:hypothetical protein